MSKIKECINNFIIDGMGLTYYENYKNNKDDSKTYKKEGEVISLSTSLVRKKFSDCFTQIIENFRNSKDGTRK